MLTIGEQLLTSHSLSSVDSSVGQVSPLLLLKFSITVLLVSLAGDRSSEKLQKSATLQAIGGLKNYNNQQCTTKLINETFV